MFKLIICFLISSMSRASEITDAMYDLAQRNGYKPSQRVVEAILQASQTYHIDPLLLESIGMVESGLKFQTRVNKNGTTDSGIFQINSVNRSKCIGFDLKTPEGSAYCAAKLLNEIRSKWSKKDSNWIGRYHSKTLKHKNKYIEKLSKVLYVKAE